MSSIPSQIGRWGEIVTKLSATKDAADKAHILAIQHQQESQDRITAVENAQTIAQTIAQSIQEKVHRKIGGVVSRCLSSVFESPYMFRILFERKRGRTEANLVFERDGHQVDPLSSTGGGPVDIAAFALRLSRMMLTRPALRRVLIMDEPLKSPSAQYRPLIKQLLEKLSSEMGVQVIMVTNIMEISAGKIHNIMEIDYNE